MVSGVPLGGRNLFQNEAGVTGFLREISQVTVASLLGSPVFLASFYLGYHSQKIKGIFSFLFFSFFTKRKQDALVIQSNLFKEGSSECGGKQMHACQSHSYSLTCQSLLFQKQLLRRLAEVLFRESIS
jgi:hypothetical protein